MSESASHPLECAACGSSDLRGSRPRGAVEHALRATGVRFHVCRTCGARGSHRGRHGGHREPRRAGEAGTGGRPLENRDRRYVRARSTARTVAMLLAAVLGVGVALFLSTCLGGR